MTGGGMDVQFAKDNSKITSILWVGFPGEAGGAGIADIIFGLHNPGGKLPMTWYPQSYVEKVDMTNMNMRPDPATRYPGRSYRFYKGDTVYSFGEGLDYSQFSHELVKTEEFVSFPLDEGHVCRSSACKSIDAMENSCNNLAFDVHLRVKNIGEFSGSHTVLLFSSPPQVHNAPQKHLLDFQKLHLTPQAFECDGRKRPTESCPWRTHSSCGKFETFIECEDLKKQSCHVWLVIVWFVIYLLQDSFLEKKGKERKND